MAPREDTRGPQRIANGASHHEGTTSGVVLDCDYLVVGAGNLGMSFVDTVLTEHPSATIVLVDRNTKAGGHWVHAYPYVRLHQSSSYYGVNSLPLATNRDRKGNERYDMYDRATGAEVLDYYDTVRAKFEKTGRVTCRFGVEYSWDAATGAHTLVPIDDPEAPAITVRCGKVVRVCTNVSVPSLRGPLLPVHEKVHFCSPNELPARVERGSYTNYVVFGSGKTGMDAIVYLVREAGVDPSHITWVVPRDVWYWLRECLAEYVSFVGMLQKVSTDSGSAREFFRGLEREGLFARLDPTRPDPKIFRGAAIDREELELLRRIPNVVRMGRATAIEDGRIVFPNGNHHEFSTEDTLLVDAMREQWISGVYAEDFRIFENENRINLGPTLMHFNGSGTAAIVAFIECALRDRDDEAKNRCCYFLRGKYSDITPECNFIGPIYLEFKTEEQVSKLPGGKKFIRNSRTNLQSPQHHRDNLLRLLWLAFGPKRFVGFRKRFAKKIESGGFSDIDHVFGAETFDCQEIAF